MTFSVGRLSNAAGIQFSFLLHCQQLVHALCMGGMQAFVQLLELSFWSLRTWELFVRKICALIYFRSLTKADERELWTYMHSVPPCMDRFFSQSAQLEGLHNEVFKNNYRKKRKRNWEDEKEE